MRKTYWKELCYVCVSGWICHLCWFFKIVVQFLQESRTSVRCFTANMPLINRQDQANVLPSFFNRSEHRSMWGRPIWRTSSSPSWAPTRRLCRRNARRCRRRSILWRHGLLFFREIRQTSTYIALELIDLGSIKMNRYLLVDVTWMVVDIHAPSFIFGFGMVHV